MTSKSTIGGQRELRTQRKLQFMKKSFLSTLMVMLLSFFVFHSCSIIKKELLAPDEPVASTDSESLEHEIDYEDGVPLNPNVSPVIVLRGSDYNMGYQYAQQLYEIFGAWALERLQADYTEEEIIALKAYQGYLKEYAPEFIDMFEGMVSGAIDAGVDLSYEEVLSDYCKDFAGNIGIYPGTERVENKEDGLSSNDCSGFAAWGSATKDGKLICGATGDHELRPELTIIVLPESGNNYIFRLSLPATPSIHPAMNNKGLAFVHHGSGAMGNEVPGYGVPLILKTQHTLRFADNAEEALAMQLSYPQSAAGLWVDVNGDAFNLDCRDPLSVRRAGDHGEQDFLYVSNTTLTESLEPFLKNEFGWPLAYFPHGGWNLDDMNSVRRCLFMWNALHNYHGNVDMDFVKMMLRFPNKPPDYATLEEADIELYEMQGEGWDTYISNLANANVGIMLPDNGDKGFYYACVGPAGRGAEPLTKDWHFYHIKPTYTFFELQLATDPASIVSAAKKKSHYNLYYANKELRKLNYEDIAYAPLDEIFNKAAMESQKGDYYLRLAQSTTGNESVCYYGKAVRAFTRCQCYAKQVYENLVLSATKPTDLGLEEWFGDWGKWEIAPSGAANP
jgi:hypothetical protein